MTHGALGAGGRRRRPGRRGGHPRGRASAVRFQARPYRAGGDVIIAREGRRSTIAESGRRTQPRQLRARARRSTLEVVRDGERRDVDVQARRAAERREPSTLPRARARRSRARAARARAARARRARRARARRATRAGGDVTFAIDARGRGVPRGASWPSAPRRSPSTPRTAGSSRRTARPTCSWSTRSTARGRRWPGFEAACVSVAAARAGRGRARRWATCEVAVRRGDQVGTAVRRRARRAACESDTPGRAQRRTSDLDRLFWAYGLRGRPARMTIEVLGELHRPLVGRRRRRSTSARRTFDMTRVLTGQLDAYVEPGPRIDRRGAAALRGVRARRAAARVLNNSPYDLAAAVAVPERGRARW